MATKLDFLDKRTYDEITGDILGMVRDSQLSIEVNFRDVSGSSVDVSSGTITVSENTVVIPAIEGGYGQISRRRIGNLEQEEDEPPIFTRETYLLIAEEDLTSPELVDRVTFDSYNWRITSFEKDTLGTHWRIEVKRD